MNTRGLILGCVAAALAGGLHNSASHASEQALQNDVLLSATSELFEQAEITRKKNSEPIPVIRVVIEGEEAEENYAFAEHPAFKRLVEHNETGAITLFEDMWETGQSSMTSVDFTGHLPDAGTLVCGYVTWEQDQNMALVLREIELAELDTQRLAFASEKEVDAALLDASCHHTSVEDIYTLAAKS